MSLYSFTKKLVSDPVDTITRATTLNTLNANDLPIIGDSRRAQENLKLEKENQAYQRDLQERIFEREDSSLQRRVQDAVAAGLNPQLALGSGASSGAVVGSSAPQLQKGANPLDALSAMVGLKSSMANLDLLNQQKTKLANENVGVQLDNLRKTWDLNYFKDAGLPTNANGDFVQMLEAIGSVIKAIRGETSNNIIGDVTDSIGGFLDSVREPKNQPSSQDVVVDNDSDKALQELKSVVKQKRQRIRDWWSDLRNKRAVKNEKKIMDNIEYLRKQEKSYGRY